MKEEEASFARLFAQMRIIDHNRRNMNKNRFQNWLTSIDPETQRYYRYWEAGKKEFRRVLKEHRDKAQ